MYSTTGMPILQSAFPTFPIDLFRSRKFKAFANHLVGQLGIGQYFRPRLYTYADFILMKFYALVTKQSTAAAAESLNQCYARYYQEKFQLYLKPYGDRSRSRRLVPHQTDVDKFFRRLTEKEIHFLFGNLLSAVNITIQRKVVGSSKLRLLVDNTEYSYYGRPQPPFEIGTYRHPGTQKARLFQGIALQGSGMTFFTEFRLLRYNQYRAKHIGVAAEWLRWQEFSLSYALMDREFYRAALVKELKSRHVLVIIPAKKYQLVVNEFLRFLHGSRPLVSSYLFQQTQGAKP